MSKKSIISTILLFSSLFAETTFFEKYENAYSEIVKMGKNSNASQAIFESINKQYETFLDKNKDNNSLVLFYFVDSLIDETALEKFSINIQKLNNAQIPISGKVMYRGLINGSFDEHFNFLKKIKENKPNIVNIDFYPIHFHSFEYFNLKRVPAYALSNCIMSRETFNFRECQHKYLIKGSIGMQSFFEILKEEDKQYERYYYALIEGAIDND